jgi:stage II sporulation protein D
VIGNTYPDTKSTGSGTIAITLTNDKTSSKAPTSVYVLSATGKAILKPLTELYLSNGTKTMTPVILPSGNQVFDDSIPATGGTLTLSGQGWGHGVGMSQDGAIAMAKMGFDFKQILNFYFTGIEVK